QRAELARDPRQLLTHFRGFDHFETRAEAGNLRPDRSRVVTPELDLDPAVRSCGTDAHAGAEHPAAELHRYRCCSGPNAQRSSAKVDLIGDEPPRVSKVEAVWTHDRFAGRVQRRDAVDAECPQAGVGIRDEVPSGAFR